MTTVQPSSLSLFSKDHLSSSFLFLISVCDLFFFNFYFLFIFGCVGSLLWRVGATLRCCGGFSCCGVQAVGAQASVIVAYRLNSCGSRALEHRLSSCGARA